MKISLTVLGCPATEQNMEQACKEFLVGFQRPIEGVVKIEADFYFKIPPTSSELKENERHRQYPSLDHCLNTVLDTGHGNLFMDDSTLYQIQGSKRWSAYPRIEITVTTDLF